MSDIDFDRLKTHMENTGGKADYIVVGFKLYNDIVEMLNKEKINKRDIKGNFLCVFPNKNLKHNESYFIGDMEVEDA